MSIRKLISRSTTTILCLIAFTAQSWAQERITISPFYSDYSVITDKLPPGWSISPFIQVSIKMEFPPNTTLEDLKKYRFQNPTIQSQILWQFMPVKLRYGDLHWDNLTLLNWNTPPVTEQEKAIIKEGKHRFCLYYHDFSMRAATIRGGNGTQPFSYVHVEGWESLCPTDPSRNDSKEIVFNVNPSLFYLVTDAPKIDLYQNNVATLSSKDGFPDFALFYRPIYREQELKYQDMVVRLIEENEQLAKQIDDKISLKKKSEEIKKDSTRLSSKEQLTKTLDAIAKFIPIHSKKYHEIDVVKTGLILQFTYGKKNKLDTLGAKFSLSRGNFLLLDNDMFYTNTLAHEFLHFFLPSILNKDSQKRLSPQEQFFFNESIIEYLAKYLYGKYVVGQDLFLTEQKRFSKVRLNKAKEVISQNTTNSVEAGDKVCGRMGAWEIYYEIFPYLLHQIASNSGKPEADFAKVLFYYMQQGHGNDVSLQNFFTYLMNSGFKIQKKNDIEKILP